MRAIHPASLLLLIGTLGAQTYVVAAGGGGNFTSLQQAINTVPDGSVLRVRQGSYNTFTLQNKSMTILADDGVIVAAGLPGGSVVTLGPTAVNQRIVLKNIAFRCQFDISELSVELRDLAGPLELEDVTLVYDTKPGDQMSISGCANVHLRRCKIQGFVGGPATTKLTIVNSAVEIAHCTIGGESTFSNAGRTAVTASASKVTVVSSSLVGGTGPTPFLLPNRTGGTGIVLSAGSALQAYGVSSVIAGGKGGDGLVMTGSSATLVGVSPAGGAGGPGTTVGSPGAAVVNDPTSTIRSLLVTGPTCGVTGNPLPGNGVSIDLRANSGDVAALIIGLQPLFYPAPFWLTVGTLFVNPLVTIGSFTVPNTGLLSVPLQLPLTLSLDKLFLLQYAVVPSVVVNEVWASNSTSIVVKS